jgi:hypothetical protein
MSKRTFGMDCRMALPRQPGSAGMRAPAWEDDVREDDVPCDEVPDLDAFRFARGMAWAAAISAPVWLAILAALTWL